MIAYCLNDVIKPIEVEKYKNIYYEVINFHAPYRTFKKTKKKVRKGHEYTFYIIDGELYETCITNNLDVIARQVEIKRYHFKRYKMVEKYKQLSIFDMGDKQ